MESKIIQAIQHGRNFLITAHVRLDGDALGSELAFYLMLQQMGKKATIYNQDPVPAHYRFLPSAENIIHELDTIEPFDVGVILDCSELDRVGEKAKMISGIGTLINIDHHISNGGFTVLTMLDAQASSTGEMLYRLMQAMNCDMTRDVSTNLYAAIITDSGGFRYSNTHAGTLRAASDLVENGADPQWISENIYESDSPSKLRLLSLVMETLSLDLESKVGSMVVTQRHFQVAGATMEHTDGFIDIPRTVKGIDISVLFTQIGDDLYKVSMRSKRKVNVEKVARRFGGGGHVNAAACRVKGGIDQVKAMILQAIKEST